MNVVHPTRVLLALCGLTLPQPRVAPRGAAPGFPEATRRVACCGQAAP